jgi:hypothetical protein
MPNQCFLPLLDDADLVEAGVLMSAYLTAWHMLFGKKQLRPGGSLLVAAKSTAMKTFPPKMTISTGRGLHQLGLHCRENRFTLGHGQANGLGRRPAPARLNALQCIHGTPNS